MSRALSPWGYLPDGWRLSTIKEEMVEVTDYVANGSFASLAENVQYKQKEDYAVLIRLVDYNNGFKDGFVYIDEHAYNFLGKSKLFGGEIIISNVGANVGTVFKAPYLKKPMSLAPNAICVKLKGNNDFYYYWFKSRIGQYSIDSLVSGSAQPKFNKTHFKSMPIPVPPIHEQDEIASILSSLDDKIEVNKKICENLEAQAQALFKHWFVDFAPFKDGKFVESELGLIPEGWRVATLNDVCIKITDGSHYSPKDDPNGTIPMLSVKDMQHNGFDYSSCKMINDEEYLKMKNNDCVPLKNDILVAKDGSYLKEIFLCQKEVKQAVLSSIAIFRCNSDIIYPEILLQMLRLPKVRKDVGDNYVSGSALPRIVLKDFKKYCFIVAPIDVQDRIIELMRLLYMQINNNEMMTRYLSTLRDTLLPKLMSGELNLNVTTNL